MTASDSADRCSTAERGKEYDRDGDGNNGDNDDDADSADNARKARLMLTKNLMTTVFELIRVHSTNQRNCEKGCGCVPGVDESGAAAAIVLIAQSAPTPCGYCDCDRFYNDDPNSGQ